ncbi:hypothetical protein FBU31_008149, partial [Coemansia sp. 'formosensis']
IPPPPVNAECHHNLYTTRVPTRGGFTTPGRQDFSLRRPSPIPQKKNSAFFSSASPLRD